MAGKTSRESVFREKDSDQRDVCEYSKDFLILRKAIIDNCLDCIRDCGRDCLDLKVKPIENIRCPLQRVRINYNMVIEENNYLNQTVAAEKETRVGML